MKVTWKNKKRPMPAVSNFGNLPFEHQQEEEDRQEAQAHTQSNKDAEVGAHSSDQSGDLDTSHHSDLSQARRLAKEFQAQGDKLAEVLLLLTCLCSFLFSFSFQILLFCGEIMF